MISRRRFLKAGSAVALASLGGACRLSRQAVPGGVIVNDVHSQLNATEVRRVVNADSVAALRDAVGCAAAENVPVSIAGGRHAMGGQQFGTDMVLIDTSDMSRVVMFDTENGLVEVEAGIRWPELIDYLLQAQSGRQHSWGIVQKQTGADRLSVGGALAANAHGRGLTYKPIVQDVESFVLIDAKGDAIRCSRDENPELFGLAIGGYGCFGAIATVTLRLGPRRKIERIVKVINIEELMPAFDWRIADGFVYGDFQFSIANESDDFLRRGVFSCYRPVDDDAPMPEERAGMSNEDWMRLAYLTHVDKQQAFEVYSNYYLSTSGQLYWSDTHQLSVYVDGYHEVLSRQMGEKSKGTELITEIYVPRDLLVTFMSRARDYLRDNDVSVIYGTIRLIEKDEECFLTLAREAWACIIFNLHVPHLPEGMEHSRQAFLRLIDLAIEHGGSYFLTYHRFASRRQIEACYPQFPEFLRLKRQYDPDERFQSDWYRHHRQMFADVL